MKKRTKKLLKDILRYSDDVELDSNVTRRKRFSVRQSNSSYKFVKAKNLTKREASYAICNNTRFVNPNNYPSLNPNM
jgi:hypothetical protein